MHHSAMMAGKLFFETYWMDGFRTILDVGSLNVNGTLRTVAPPDAEFIGVDLAPGAGVDMVLDDPYVYPFGDDTMDCVISTSCYEHDRMFWLSFAEACRVVSPGGFIYINAPSTGPYHAWPYDHWRFYPDAGVGLESWARRLKFDITLIESFLVPTTTEQFGDATMVFGKGATNRPSASLADKIPTAIMIRREGSSDLMKPAHIGRSG